MSSRKPFRKQLHALCAEVHADDGLDSRELARQTRTSQHGHRKAWQLCRQIARTLSDILAGECDDPNLCNLDVVSVEPAPDTSRLLVTVAVPSRSEPVDPVLVLGRLQHAAGLMRCEVAAAITRRKVPVLVFRLAASRSAANSSS
jgi:ribosome-binding factor A